MTASLFVEHVGNGCGLRRWEQAILLIRGEINIIIGFTSLEKMGDSGSKWGIIRLKKL